MKAAFFLAPTGRGQGLTTVALGLVAALDRRGVRVSFYKPISEDSSDQSQPERSTHFLRATTTLAPPDPLPLAEARKLVSGGRLDELLGTVVGTFEKSIENADLTIVEGLLPSGDDPYRGSLNHELVRTLSAQVILVMGMAGRSILDLDDQIEYARQIYGGVENIFGLIVNGCPVEHAGEMWNHFGDSRLFRRRDCRLIGVIPHNEALTFSRAIDVQRHLNAAVIYTGEMESRRVKSTSLLARTVPNLLHALTPGAMLVTPADRSDVILAVSMAALSHVPLSGLILTGETELDNRIIDFCQAAFATGLPLFRVQMDSYSTATKLHQMSREVPIDDLVRIRSAMDHVAQHIDIDLLISNSRTRLEFRLSPAAFLYQLTEKARAANKRIVLPEGSEPRTVKAASICGRRGIARCVLLGKPSEVRTVARSQDVELPDNVEILDPGLIRQNYVNALYEARRHKGLSMEMAASQLEDNVVLGTMMLALGEVDGLVSGAVHSTANTIRPALQVIKTKPNAHSVSSIFFMCLPEQVLVYGDCAVVPDPDAETLADIAIQSADSAKTFGIPSRVAMLSYSTGESGSGADVDKVREATKLGQNKRPDLLIDGPLQYDAAFMPDV